MEVEGCGGGEVDVEAALHVSLLAVLLAALANTLLYLAVCKPYIFQERNHFALGLYATA